MKNIRNKQKTSNRPASMDWTLILIVLVLTVIGILMQYSASSYDLSYVKSQGAFAILGLVLMFVISRIPVSFWNTISIWAYSAALLMCAACYFLGKDAKGAKRWIRFGPVGIQPAELLKIGLIIAIAAIICRYINEINNEEELKLFQTIRNLKNRSLGKIIKTHKGYVIPVLLTIAAVGVVAIVNKDLGTAIIIFLIGYVMLFMISPRIKALLAVIIAAAAAGVGLILAFPYRMGRITAWLHLEENDTTLGYQIKQGLYAVGSGGLFGKGLGKSIQKDVIPEAHTDMIYSIVCEELGIIGGIVIVVLFILLIWRLKKIYSQVTDLFGKLIIIGVATHFAAQAFVNMAVLTNLIPNTGVPLPFLSYGGSSLVCLLMEVGLVMSVRRASLVKGNIVYKV